MSAILKWVAGIAAGVIIGVSVFLLTRLGGKFNPAHPPTVKAELVLTDFHLSPDPIPIGGEAHVLVSVYNQGNTSASQCRIDLRRSCRGRTSEGAINDSLKSEEFGLPPSTSRTVDIRTVGYNGPCVAVFSAIVNCPNARSDSMTLKVRVAGR